MGLSTDNIDGGDQSKEGFAWPTTTEEIVKVTMELELGMLIRHLNPYADVMRLCPGDPTRPEGALHPEGLLKGNAVLKQVEEAARTNVQQVLMEMETREVEYLSWQFKDLPRLVKRAVRMEYRHLYKQTGVWVTDHLLIGYEGSNGG